MDKVWLKKVLAGGNSGNGFKVGTVLTLGWFWARRSGSRLLYRGRNLEQINFGEILAAADADAKQISAPRWISHQAGSAYYYVVRAVDRFGCGKQTYRAMVKVAIDGQGKPAAGRCNNITAVAGQQEAGGKIGLMWYYSPMGQGGEPYCFKIYSDKGAGHLDLERPLGTIGYRGPGFYGYEAADCTAGENIFAIRTADKEGRENVCWGRKGVEFSDRQPDGIEILRMETQ